MHQTREWEEKARSGGEGWGGGGGDDRKFLLLFDPHHALFPLG